MRKALSFSERTANHIGAIWYFIHLTMRVLWLGLRRSLFLHDYRFFND